MYHPHPIFFKKWFLSFLFLSEHHFYILVGSRKASWGKWHLDGALTSIAVLKIIAPASFSYLNQTELLVQNMSYFSLVQS